MKKKGLLRISAGLAVMILGSTTLVGCGDETTTVDVDTSIAKITNREGLLEEWGVNAGSRSIQLTQAIAKLRGDGHSIEFKSSNEEVATIDGAGKITPKAAGTVTFTITLDGVVADTIEITFVASSYQSLETVTKAILASNGDSTPVYFFKGVVTQLIATKAFTIQDCEYAMYVYANPETVCEGHKLAVGDVVGITSHAQLYNGLIETKTETTVTYLPDEPAERVAAKTVQNKDLTDALQSVLVNVNNLKPVGALTEATSNAYGELQVTDGTSESKVTIYVNKYLPADTLTAINTKLKKLANEAYTANLKDIVVSKYNDFQYLVTDANQIELVEAEAVNPTAVTISNVDDVKQLIVGKSATLALTFAPDNCNAKAMTYASSDPTVASVDENGKITALKVGTTKITATSAVVDTVKAEVDISVIAPKFVTEPIIGEEYLMGMESTSKGLIYINGEMDGYYGKTVGLKEDAAKFVIEKGEGDNANKFALKCVKTSKYIDIQLSGTHKNYVYSDTAAYFSYDKANFSYFKTIESKDYYFGTSGTYSTASVTEGLQEFPARVYPVYMADAPVVGSTIKFGGYHYNLETPKYIYFDGTLDGTYFKTVEGIDNADVFTVEEGTAEGRFALKTSAGKYIERKQPEGKTFYGASLADAKSEATDFIWNAANMTFETIGVNAGTCLGTSGTKTFTTIGYTKKDATDMVWMHAYLVDEPKAHGESASDPLTIAEALAIGAELADKAATPKVYYIRGKVAKVASAFSIQYGNIAVWVTDDGQVNSDQTKMFEFYKLGGLNGARLMSDTDIEVGDVITTKAQIYKYVDSKGKITYETSDACPTVAITKANTDVRGIAFDRLYSTIGQNSSVTIKAGIAPTTLPKDLSKITWSVDDANKGTLSATSGAEVTFTSKEISGNATITASWKENESATPITATYLVRIEGPFNGMKFEFNGSLTPTTSSDAKVEFTDSTTGCTFAVEKNSASTAAGGDKQGYLGSSSAAELRIYKNQKLTFGVPSGKTVSYFEVGVTNSNANFDDATNVFTNGASSQVWHTGECCLVNAYIYKITPTDGTQNVSIVAGKGAYRISYVKVVFAA